MSLLLVLLIGDASDFGAAGWVIYENDERNVEKIPGADSNVTHPVHVTPEQAEAHDMHLSNIVRSHAGGKDREATAKRQYLQVLTPLSHSLHRLHFLFSPPSPTRSLP